MAKGATKHQQGILVVSSAVCNPHLRGHLQCNMIDVKYPMSTPAICCQNKTWPLKQLTPHTVFRIKSIPSFVKIISVWILQSFLPSKLSNTVSGLPTVSPSITLTGPITGLGRCGERALAKKLNN